MGKNLNKVSAAGLIIALGIIYGDIGTSPLYVFNAIISNKVISEQLIIGTLSCIIWTITLQTTLKYVILVLQADNNGEGGTFSLYALVRRRKKWLVIPAMIGGAALLADGIITPPISVTSAIEGLKELP
ncbi:MAG: KUP/HAK/KT family potassium transporter, partial [Chitinophagaceae bacterium]|nr:KUP/HAK/KT family potassium transporter [Chitinophagaceae bacterium]